MDLLGQISESLVTRGLRVISESRLRPAIIKMKRGTVIEADHARITKHPHTGTKILVFGVKPGVYPQFASTFQRISTRNNSLIGRMRDFTAPGQYVPCVSCGQDETGWADPDEEGRYDAHKDYQWNNRFRHIMTAFMENVEDIQWGHEAEKKSHTDDRIDWRGRIALNRAMLPISQMLTFPEVILQNWWPQLIAGVNTTIAARSQHFGRDPVVKLIGINPEQDYLLAQWISQGHEGVSHFPLDTKFAELASLLEEESADHWN